MRYVQHNFIQSVKESLSKDKLLLFFVAAGLIGCALYGHVFSLGMFGSNHIFLSYMLVGMGAFLSAITYAPLMSILMIYEMTLSYQIVLPLMLACVISHFIADRIKEDSIYGKREWDL